MLFHPKVNKPLLHILRCPSGSWSPCTHPAVSCLVKGGHGFSNGYSLVQCNGLGASCLAPDLKCWGKRPLNLTKTIASEAQISTTVAREAWGYTFMLRNATWHKLTTATDHGYFVSESLFTHTHISYSNVQKQGKGCRFFVLKCPISLSPLLSLNSYISTGPVDSHLHVHTHKREKELYVSSSVF